MTECNPKTHLNQLSTSWSEVNRAHTGPDATMAAARRDLLDRYGGAVSRYLHGSLRDAGDAEELYQEFALRLLRGDFHRATPAYGRFRDFLKTALLRLVSRHRARRQSGPLPLANDVIDQAPSDLSRAEQEFLRSWRAELLASAWQALERFEEESGRPFYQVLRLRVEYPDLSCGQLADQLATRLGKSVTPAAYRQALHRAREAFAGFLLKEVAHSLSDPDPDGIERELADLGLLEYCRPALARPAGLCEGPPRLD